MCRFLLILLIYAAHNVLDGKGQLDYTRLKPVLFEFPTYSYIATGEIIGKCLNLDKQPGMCAKESMAPDGIVRLSKIEVHPQYLDEYMKYAVEVGEVSLRTEPGVLTMYAMGEKENPCKVTILETYSSKEAYEKHIASEHFQKVRVYDNTLKYSCIVRNIVGFSRKVVTLHKNKTIQLWQYPNVLNAIALALS